jgi:membrane protein implicated in regulation of membrane protease activity
VDLVLLVLATFFVWETARFAAETYAPGHFATTRVVHPLLVAALPLAVLWPEWVTALGVAGASGLLVAVVDRFVAPSAPPAILPRGTTRHGLPPLP